MADAGRMTERIRDVEQMPVYQCFAELALRLEVDTRKYGPDFRWLRIQCLRSSESVCADMTKGFYSQYSAEYLQGLHRSRREARETIYHIRYAMGSGQLDDQIARGLISDYEAACVQPANLIASIERKIRQHGKSKDLPYLVREETGEYDTEMLSAGVPIGHQP